MKYNAFLFIAFTLFFSCKEKNTTTPHIEIQTEKGDIEIELYPLQAPKTVAAFLVLHRFRIIHRRQFLPRPE
jgi:peptidyl-prolyl cis-trans isomerase A (cyclophilin A)